jgi:ornithine carrier protein
MQMQDVRGAKETMKKFSGPLQLISQTIGQRGFLGMYRGQSLTMARELIGGVAWFGSYETICGLFLKREAAKTKPGSSPMQKGDLHPWKIATAGAIAGTNDFNFKGMAFNASFYPGDLLKSNVQIQSALDGKDLSFREVAKQIYKESGIRGFFRGFGLTVLRSAPTSACIFMTYEFLNKNP